MKHLKHFNESAVIISNQMSPIIGYKNDIESGETGLMNGYYTGTAFVGDEETERQGDVNYSSPFHSGQVVGDDVEDTEEVDFSFHRRIDGETVERLLSDHISKNYNGKIVKIVYH
jgi:hypothetical protein